MIYLLSNQFLEVLLLQPGSKNVSQDFIYLFNVMKRVLSSSF